MESAYYELEIQQEQQEEMQKMLQWLERNIEILNPDAAFTEEDRSYLRSQAIVL